MEWGAQHSAVLNSSVECRLVQQILVQGRLQVNLNLRQQNYALTQLAIFRGHQGCSLAWRQPLDLMLTLDLMRCLVYAHSMLLPCVRCFEVCRDVSRINGVVFLWSFLFLL